MKIDVTTIFFNSNIDGGTATATWCVSIGQGKDKKINNGIPGLNDILDGLIYKSVSNRDWVDTSAGSKNNEYLLISKFDKIFINGAQRESLNLIGLLVREHTKSHEGRLRISFPPYASYNDGESEFTNQVTYQTISEILGCGKIDGSGGCWFVDDISVLNQDELHLSCIVVDPNGPKIYKTSQNRSGEWQSLSSDRPDYEIARLPYSLDKPLKNKTLQIIYYGAPGTGKSHTIAKETNPRNSVRTTFHPDSDYASFVGAYKPTMEYVDFSYITDGKVKYAQRAKSDDGREHPGTQQKIVYKYVPQAFLKAYVAAWKAYGTNTPYNLIIEEINRGNCAQIFGDLFQLLDRSDEGYSSYPIAADDDIRKFLVSDEKGFEGLDITDPETYAAISGFEVRNENGELVINGAEVLSGEKLLLPPTLYIWATMNTSDQSLFPIDSAFKRRWNWEYIPIDYDKKDWYIQVGEQYYSWGRFLALINPEILDLTGSADKQMGFFFTKPDSLRDGQKDRDVISERLFINKVLFYLWTDVLKDYDLSKKPFVYEEGGKKKAFSFTDFFGKNTTENLKRFFAGIDGLETATISEPSDKNDGVFSVTFPDGIVINQPTLTSTYMESLRKIGLDQVAKVSEEKGYKNPLVTQEKVESLVKPRRYKEIDGWYVLLGPDTYPYYTKLEMLNYELNLNLDIKHK